MDQDPTDLLIDRVAEAVVRKIEEREKIEAIAQAVLDRLQSKTTTSSKRRGSAGRRTPQARRTLKMKAQSAPSASAASRAAQSQVANRKSKMARR